MGKVVLTVTIDSHLDQWIKTQGGKKSRVVNDLLTQAWDARKDKPIKEKISLDEHMRRLYLEMEAKE